MWYRFAQNNAKTVWKNTPIGEGLLLTFPMLKNGYKTYPDILITFKHSQTPIRGNIPFYNFKPFSKKISQEEINEILLEIQNQLAKYPEGFLSKNLGNEFVIKMVLEFIDKNLAGLTIRGQNYITVEKNQIAHALDHEIGHALDFTRVPAVAYINDPFNSKGGTYMSPSEYGKTNNYEAFAEAYQTLMENGLDYRLSNNSEENIDKNRLFEYIAEMLKSKKFTELKFPQLSRPSNDLPEGTQNIRDMRISTLVGGFQNAIDKYQGDKQKYGTELLNDKQKIADIVAFMNKTRSEFFVLPVKQEEITAALSYIKQQVDKEKYYQGKVFPKDRPDTFDERIPLLSLPENIFNEISKYNIQKSQNSTQKLIISNATKKPPTPQEKNNLINVIEKSKWQNLVEVSANDVRKYRSIQSILQVRNRKDSGQDIIVAFYRYLVESIFPNTLLKSPEDFLFFDFKLTPQGYVLDQSALEKQFNYVLSLYQKRNGEMPQDQLNQVRTEVFKLINIYAEKYKKLLDYKERDPKNPLPFEYIGRQIGKVLNPTNYLDLAKKAVDKIVIRKGVPRANKTNEMFMKLYNNDLLNADQKQELLEYYRLKQNSVKK